LKNAFDQGLGTVRPGWSLLIGDAAGLAYTQSGEGIRPAIESALIAARLLAKHQDAPEQVPQAYDAAVRARFGRRGDRPGRPLPEWLKALAAPGLMRSKWFTRRVVTEKWFLRSTGLPPGHPGRTAPTN
jgi:flavin-dependent dehydrogenase